MLDAARPGHVGDVNETVDALLELDEGAEVRQVADLARDAAADGVLLGDALPGIGKRVLERKRDAPGLGIDVGDDGLDRVARRHDLGGILDLLGPRHLGHVDEALDAVLELHEGAVIGDVRDAAGDARARRILLRNVGPGIFRELLGAERDALGLAVELENDDVDLVADLHEVGGVVDAAPGHVGDVEQAVEASEVHERAVVGQVLHRSAQHASLFEELQSFLLAGFLLDLDDRLAREDDVAALLVDRDDLEIQVLAAQGLEVLDRFDVDERARQERLDADVDGESSLDPVDDAAADGRARPVGLLDLVPDLHLLGFVLREDDVAVLVFRPLEENVDRVALLDRDLAREVGELGERDDALRFVADVDDHFRGGDGQDPAPDDLALLQVLEGVLVLGEEVLVLLDRQFLFGFHRLGFPTSWFALFARHQKRGPLS